MDIIISGLVGYETALKLYRENKDFLDERFPGFYIEQFLDLQAKEKGPSREDMPHGRVPINDGGLFAALWQLCEEENCGCEVDIKAIPIRQEVIEICELFDVNPYEASSKGAWIAAADGGAADGGAANDAAADGTAAEKRLAENELAENELAGNETIIGKTTKGKARVVLMGTDDKTGKRLQRFLTPPERQKKDMENKGDRARFSDSKK